MSWLLASVSAQCASLPCDLLLTSPEEIVLRQLRTEVLSPYENLRRLGRGGTHPKFASLNAELNAIVKKSLPKRGSTANAEVAAYLLDQFFGEIVNVPPTVMRESHGVLVSLQMWIDDAEPVTTIADSRFKRSLHFFDYLIDNTDRRPSNLISKNGKYYAIDNGFSFRSVMIKNFFKKGKYAENAWSQTLSECCTRWFNSGFAKREVTERLVGVLPPRDVYNRLKNSSVADYFALFHGVLSDEEIWFFLKRRQVYVQTIEEWLNAGHSYPED